MTEDGSLIDIGLVGDLSGPQRGWLLQQRECTDALAASGIGIVKPQALLEKSDYAWIVIEIALGAGRVFLGHDRVQPAHHCARWTVFAGNDDILQDTVSSRQCRRPQIADSHPCPVCEFEIFGNPTGKAQTETRLG